MLFSVCAAGARVCGQGQEGCEQRCFRTPARVKAQRQERHTACLGSRVQPLKKTFLYRHVLVCLVLVDAGDMEKDQNKRNLPQEALDLVDKR